MGKTGTDEIFAPKGTKEDPGHDIYPNVFNKLGPWADTDIAHRRAVMLEVLRVLAGFESTWNWHEGRDTTNRKSNKPKTTEAGAWPAQSPPRITSRRSLEPLSSQTRL